MRLRGCPRAAETVRAARAEPCPDLAAHLEGCPSCREARRVAAALQSLADGEPPRALPPAATLWWRAAIVRRLAADRPPEGPPWLGALLAGAAAVGLAVALTAGTFVASPLPRTLAATLAAGGGGTLVVLLAAAPLVLLVALAWLAAE